MNLNETEIIKYRVKYNGNVLLEAVSRTAAEQFVSGLDKNVQETVEIVPITNDGSQILLG